MAPGPPLPLPFGRGPPDARSVTFVVGSEAFELPRPFLAMHSPLWSQRLAEEPQLHTVFLEGDAESFGAFVRFLRCSEGDAGEVTPENVMPLLRWGCELGVDHIPGQCEAFLLTGAPSGLEPEELLDVAARYDLPRLYARATEAVAHHTHHLKVPEAGDRAPLPETFGSESIREDVLRAHLNMGALVGDGEARRRHRFADHTGLQGPGQRARLMWKSRGRFERPPPEPEDHNWRSLQTIWPHHTFYGEDWTVVPRETQPTTRTKGASARSARLNVARGIVGAAGS